MEIRYPGGVGYGLVELTTDIDPGIIISASIFSALSVDESLCTWVDFGISDPAYSFGSRIFSIISGYISFDCPLSWSGHYIIKNNSVLYLRIRGLLTLPLTAQADKLAASNVKGLQSIARAVFSTP